MKKSLINFPVSTKTLLQITWLIVIAMAFVSGYFHLSFVTLQRKYATLEDKYVRVRDYLGVPTTQRIIESTYDPAQ